MAAQANVSQVPFNAYPWQANHPYAPGAVVTPTSAPNPSAIQITNANFITALTGWTAVGGGGAWTWDGTIGYSGGVGSAKITSGATNASLINTQQVAVLPGQVIDIDCAFGFCSAPIGSGCIGQVGITWYDDTHTLISSQYGTAVDGGYIILFGTTPNFWIISATCTAPNNAAFAAASILVQNASGQPSYVDAFEWDYVAPNSATSSTTPPQYFTNVTSSTNTTVSGNAEPDWTNGGTNTGNVADSGITWARGTASMIFWYWLPLMESGSAQPLWPTSVGAFVSDGSAPSNFHWQALTPQIQDVNCPQQSKVALSGASKIYVANGDIVRYCATTDPMDWTSVADAGFLPTGLQAYGSNGVTAMGLYRACACVFNAEGFQIWQIDEDPANMTLLDAKPVGCSYPKTVVPVNDDLFFLAAVGLRSVGISGAAGNADSGDVGMPVDPIVFAGILYAQANGVEPVACYLPSLGQVWLHFPGWNAAGQFQPQTGAYATGAHVMVYTMTRTGEVGAWSHHVFPFAGATIECFQVHLDQLYIKSGDDVLVYDPNTLQDFNGDAYNSVSRATNFPGVCQWPYLDLSQLGITKKFDGLDVVTSTNSTLTISIGFDQSNPAAFTDPFTLAPGDSVPGTMIPLPMLAPSFSVLLQWSSSENVTIFAVNLYISDQRITS